MTLEEAKEFYFQYKGCSFHMDREEPGKYNQFRSLAPGKEVLSKWDEELLEDLFERLRAGSARAWICHGDIINILKRGNCSTAIWAERLLKETGQMGRLDIKNQILILENMAGRNKALSDGGVCFFCRYTDLGKKMKEVMERFIDDLVPRVRNRRSDDIGWQDIQSRFDRAVKNFRSAFDKWG